MLAQTHTTFTLINGAATGAGIASGRPHPGLALGTNNAAGGV
jgi:hypothetical protein